MFSQLYQGAENEISKQFLNLVWYCLCWVFSSIKYNECDITTPDDFGITYPQTKNVQSGLNQREGWSFMTSIKAMVTPG